MQAQRVARKLDLKIAVLRTETKQKNKIAASRASLK